MYDKSEIIELCIKAIEDNECTKFEEMSLYVAPALSTLYSWNLEELEAIKSALERNKVNAKAKLRKQWLKPEAAPALQIAAYKLMADEEEFNRITTNKSEVKADLKGGVMINIEPLEGCASLPE